jgi:hypothetical protein
MMNSSSTFRAGRAASDAVVRAHRHHATPGSGFGIGRVELRLEIVNVELFFP